MSAIDLVLDMKYSERLRINSPSIDPVIGTKEISSASVTLRDTDLAVAGSVSAAAVTGVTVGATASPGPKAWYLLRPSVLALPVPGEFGDVYTLAFLIIDTDGEYWEPVVQITIFPDGV